MSSGSKIVTKTSQTRLPRAQRGLVRGIVIFAWLTFWINAAFFPCCEAIAAAVGHEQAVHTADAHPAHECDETHTDHPDHAPHSSCGQFVKTGPASIDQTAVFGDGQLELPAITPDVAIAVRPVEVNRFRLTSYSTPPPKIPRYLRDLRIRI